ncbi:LANO_0C08306g1_1 [Lachancea nothofagi CBS 11611]|uniref:LANO_0C08306g1_1 n=1 Tax=Lachancea nothofagi CBS 11611 TaxID=1266666 RepID=A0A1G4J945_9SACH|nr:LANO_0C08306g1_1 [Lachancea nothofagi CBS 11611]
MADYYREQDMLYSKQSYGNDSINSQYESYDSTSRPNHRPKGFLAESHSFFDRFKSKLNLFRGFDDSNESSMDQNSTANRQSQLWNAIKRKPIQMIVDDPISRGQLHDAHQHDPILESANTFLTDNNQNYDKLSNSPKKKEAASSVPLSGSPFASSGISDFIGFENDPVIGKPTSPWDKITAKSALKSSTTLQTIQKRLLQVSMKKEDVSKTYQKLLKELSEWWQDTIEAEENMELISDLQRLFHEDLVFEQRLASKLREVSKALEFTKMREEEMLQERKELQHTIKRYGQMRAKKGNHSEEAHFLKEKVVTRQNSLSVITGHYQQSLSTTARELFVNASVEYFETASDMKDTSKRFFQNSVNYLRTIQADNIEQHIEDLRRKRADKHWSRLTPQERDDPNRLVEIMSGMYNGQDSLMRCVNRKTAPKNLAKVTIGTGKENQPQSDNQSELRLEFRTGLEDSLSQLPSESNNKSETDPSFSKMSDYAKIRAKRNIQVSSLDSNRTLRCEGLTQQGRENVRPRLPYPDTTETIRAQIENLKSGFGGNNASHGFGFKQCEDDGVIIGLSRDNHDTYEPEQELNRNKWIESPRG